MSREMEITEWIVLVGVIVLFAVLILGGIWIIISGATILSKIIGEVAAGFGLILGGVALIIIGVVLFYYIVYKKFRFAPREKI